MTETIQKPPPSARAAQNGKTSGRLTGVFPKVMWWAGKRNARARAGIQYDPRVRTLYLLEADSAFPHVTDVHPRTCDHFLGYIASLYASVRVM